MNLENLTTEQLEEFVRKMEQDKQGTARELFPAKNPGFVKVAMIYLKFAQTRIEFLEQESKGRESRAAKLKEKLDSIYTLLPDYAQWL